ncbi:MAG: autotransporter domain-containing protein [Saezia sp.]
MRVSRLNNEYQLIDKSNQYASGDYHTWGYGMSAEYGYRAELARQWFVEPQVGLTLGRINSSTHTTDNGLRIKQAADNLVSTRVGVLFGKAFGESAQSGNAYVRASWIHDFNRDGDVSAAYSTQSIKLDTLDRRGDALEVNVGANVKLARQWRAYGELSKTWGNVVQTNWQADVGVRFNW